jgi:hypothetical protein
MGNGTFFGKKEKKRNISKGSKMSFIMIKESM